MNGERSRAGVRRRWNLRRFNQTATDISIDVDLRLRRDAITCPLCDVSLTDAPNRPHSKEMDHIVTARNGGRHELSNVRIICRTCNNNARVAEHGVLGQLREFNRSAASNRQLEGESAA